MKHNNSNDREDTDRKTKTTDKRRKKNETQHQVDEETKGLSHTVKSVTAET